MAPSVTQLLTAALLIASTSAVAQPPAVEPRAHDGLRLSMALSVETSFNDHHLHHNGGRLTFGLQLGRHVAVEAFGGLMSPSVHREALLAQLIVVDASSPLTGGAGLTGLWQSFANGGVQARWTPLTGRVSLLDEWHVAFDVYGVAGMSMEAVAHVKLPYQWSDGPYGVWGGVLTGRPYTYSARPGIVHGVGARVWPTSWMAFVIDARAMTSLSPRPPHQRAELPYPFTLSTLSFGVATSFDAGELALLL